MKPSLKWALGAVLAFGLLFALGFRRDRPASEIESRRARPPSKFITVDGVRTHYRDRGRGPTVVLLHGSNASLFAWEGWVDVLAKDHRVITMDLPGQGVTGPDPEGRYTDADEVAWVHAFIQALGLDHFTLGGNSMGGGIAWRYTVLHPEKVERLILVDAYGLEREEKLPFSMRFFEAPVLSHVVRWVTPRFMLRHAVSSTYGDPAHVSDETVDLYEDMLLRDGNREATRQRFALDDDNSLEQRLGEIKVPTLILWGSKDTWILPKYAERFDALIPDSKLVMFDGLGHVPMEEDPVATVAAVREFLATSPPN